MKNIRQIEQSAPDWECDPQSEELFHLRHFRALPMEKKLQAVEEMCALAQAFQTGRKIQPDASPSPHPQK